MRYKLELLDRLGNLVATDGLEAIDDLHALHYARRKYPLGLNVRCEERDGQRQVTMVIGQSLRPAYSPIIRRGLRRAP